MAHWWLTPCRIPPASGHPYRLAVVHVILAASAILSLDSQARCGPVRITVVKCRASEIEALWQRQTAGMYPIWVFWHLGPVVLFSLPFVTRSETTPPEEVLAILSVIGGIGLVAIVTFLAWERWDLSFVGEQWIEMQEKKPRYVLLLILGLRSVSFLSVIALAFRYTLDARGSALSAKTHQFMILTALVAWVVIALSSLSVLIFPISPIAFKILNNEFMPAQDKAASVKRFAGLMAIVFLLEQVLDRLPTKEAQFRPAVAFLLLATTVVPVAVASLYGFIILWWDSMFKLLEPD